MKYVGSKNRIAKDIAPIIQSYIDNSFCQGYIEPFVGGANMIDKIKCKNKIGYDSHKYLIALLNHVKNGIDDLPVTISKDLYNAVRQNPDNYEDWFVGLVGFCASYNGKWFDGYANHVVTKIGKVRNYTDESIRNIKKQTALLKDTSFICKDFREIKDVKNCVIYCDPPYKDTTKYNCDSFPYEDFYEWCRCMAEDNIVLVSEYNMPDDFECIWQKDIICSLDKNSRTKRNEKLFIKSIDKHNNNMV